MTIKYYKNQDLAYANRKRRRDISSYQYDATEDNNSVKLGDGGTTTIITSSSNICNYVVIDDTRWYAVAYTYLNGGQVKLQLRRDVIGEFGLDGFTGKIERGFTNTFLRNRKELSLNQILKERIKLVPNEMTYGNYTVSTHKDEAWGVIYLTKPTELNPITGSAYTDTPAIQIPAFAPPIMKNWDYIENNESYYSGFEGSFVPTIMFDVWLNITRTGGSVNSKTLRLPVQFRYYPADPDIPSDTSKWIASIMKVNNEYYEPSSSNHYFIMNITSDTLTFNDIADKIGFYFNIYSQLGEYSDYIPVLNDPAGDKDYNGKVLIHNIEGVDKEIKYSVANSYYQNEPTTSDAIDIINDVLTNTITLQGWTGNVVSTYAQPLVQSFPNYKVKTYTYSVLTPEQAGYLTLNVAQDLIDEPYIVYVIPLFDVIITGQNSYNKTIDRDIAWQIFNTVIQYCSGENSYLVDAQIYPYCPILTDIAASINGYPFFNIETTSFETTVSAYLNPYLDVKKEYIKREYCLISPVQSGSFKFNYYDYSNNFVEEEGDDTYNHDFISIKIKTALKPLNIISSAVIQPKQGSLIGMTYDSDLRGCQTSTNGFEVSLSTNKFQEYVRNNSNYQAIFGLQREELSKQHEVERVNEITSAVVNTVSATAMGAIGGASMADVSYFGTSAKAVGAISGGAIAATTVGTAMGVQATENEKLREYEKYIQQENFNLQIGTIKNIPNQISRISSFNEIILKDFCYIIEIYECSDEEGEIVDNYIEKFGYGLGIIGEYNNFKSNNWFLRGTLITSNLIPILHNIAREELNGGIYYIYE